MKKKILTRIISVLLIAVLCTGLVPASWAAGIERPGFKFTRLTDLQMQTLYAYSDFPDDQNDPNATYVMQPGELMSPYGGHKLFEFSYDFSQFCDIKLYEMREGFDGSNPDLFGDYQKAAKEYNRIRYDKASNYADKQAWETALASAYGNMMAADPRARTSGGNLDPLGYLNVHQIDEKKEWEAGNPEEWPDPDTAANELEIVGRALDENKDPVWVADDHKQPDFSTYAASPSRGSTKAIEVPEDFYINRFTWDGMVWPNDTGPMDPFAENDPGSEYYLIVAEPLGVPRDDANNTWVDWTRVFLSFIVIQVDVNIGPVGNVSEGEEQDLDPVGVVSGSFLWNYTDLILEGKAPLNFTRYYNSRSNAESAMGPDWRHNYDFELIQSSRYFMTLLTPEGYRIWYKLERGENNSVFYLSPAGCDYRLQETPDEGYDIVLLNGTIRHVNDGYDLVHIDGTTRHFDENFVYEHVSRFGRVIYDLSYSDDRLTQVTGVAGTLFFEYTGDQLTKVRDNTTNNTGRSVTLTYTSGHLNTVTNPDNNSLTYFYDNNGYLESIDDFTNTQYIFNVYDEEGYGRVVQQILGDDHQSSENISDVDYNIKSMVNTFETPSGRVSEYYYNGVNNVSLIKTYLKDPVTGALTLYETKEYADGRLMKHIDREGNETNFERNAWGQVTLITYPDSSQESFKYDDDDTHLLLEHTLPEQIITYEYNEFGYVIKETVSDRTNRLPAIRSAPQELVTEYEYDSDQNLIQVRFYGGTDTPEITDYAYDARGLLTKITQHDDQLGALETVLTYDDVGRLETETTPGGAVTEYGYTDAGKLESVTDAYGHEVTYGVNPNGFVESISEEINNETVATTIGYNVMSQVTSQTDALGNTTALLTCLA